MSDLHNISFNDVKGTEYSLKYDRSFAKDFNNNINKVQKYLDNLVVINLQEYVSYKRGIQSDSIRIATVLGSGLVIINVNYAEYQAYSKRIKKRVGKRGTYPFERMKSDREKSILNQLQAYSRRLNK